MPNSRLAPAKDGSSSASPPKIEAGLRSEIRFRRRECNLRKARAERLVTALTMTQGSGEPSPDRGANFGVGTGVPARKGTDLIAVTRRAVAGTAIGRRDLLDAKGPCDGIRIRLAETAEAKRKERCPHSLVRRRIFAECHDPASVTLHGI